MSEWCGAHPSSVDGEDAHHCLHPVDENDTDEVCCWCGDLFIGAGPRGDHGPFRPPRQGDTYESPDGSAWTVVSTNGAIGLSGPLPCRGMEYVEAKTLVNEWKRRG